jgi:SAM-dependent methyltransferase
MGPAEAVASEPFDRRLRRKARGRRFRNDGADFLLRHAAAEIEARQALLSPLPPGPVLDWGADLAVPAGCWCVRADAARARLPATGLRLEAEEDRLPIGSGRLAGYRSVLMLHGVNDLPGALLLARRALMPGGRFLAVLPAGIALPQLRAALLQADVEATGKVAARVGPTVDPAQGAGLLARAGFLEPVAEVEQLSARYAGLLPLAHDLRAMGETGWLSLRSRVPLRRSAWAMAEAAFARDAEADGKVTVTFDLLYLSGVAPSPSR